MQQKWYLSTQEGLSSFLTDLLLIFLNVKKNKSGIYATVLPIVHLQRLQINVIEHNNNKIIILNYIRNIMVVHKSSLTVEKYHFQFPT